DPGGARSAAGGPREGRGRAGGPAPPRTADRRGAGRRARGIVAPRMAALPSGSTLKRILIILILAVGLPSAGAYALIQAASQPATDRSKADPSELLLQTEDASFVSSDGVSLAGWFLRGRRGAPPILLCHDLGGSRSQLLNAAVA